MSENDSEFEYILLFFSIFKKLLTKYCLHIYSLKSIMRRAIITSAS